MDDILVRVDNLKKYFPIRAGVFQRVVGHVRAVDGVSFQIPRGQTLGLVGESGCGKTTVGRTMLRLHEPTAGSVAFSGRELFQMDRRSLRQLRPRMQLIFQDPYSSLQPRMPVGEIIGEGVREHGVVPRDQYKKHIETVMDNCGLPRYYIDRYPHEFSGGQRQRIGIARALALNPEFIVADEPVSALDVSIQAQILNLMMDLQQRFALTYLFISHDLGVVQHISNQVAVMYLGSLVELGQKQRIFERPLHPYSEALVSAAPVPDPDVKRKRVVLQGDIPSPADPPPGCKFHTRCARRMERCARDVPALRDLGGGHWVACHLYEGVGSDEARNP